MNELAEFCGACCILLILIGVLVCLFAYLYDWLYDQ